MQNQRGWERALHHALVENLRRAGSIVNGDVLIQMPKRL